MYASHQPFAMFPGVPSPWLNTTKWIELALVLHSQSNLDARTLARWIDKLAQHVHGMHDRDTYEATFGVLPREALEIEQQDMAGAQLAADELGIAILARRRGNMGPSLIVQLPNWDTNSFARHAGYDGWGL